MFRFFKWLITGDGHIHIWKMVEHFDGNYLQCEICGNVKYQNHAHKWRTIDLSNLTTGDDIVGRISYCECTICGEHTFFKMNIRKEKTIRGSWGD